MSSGSSRDQEEATTYPTTGIIGTKELPEGQWDWNSPHLQEQQDSTEPSL